MGYFRPTFYYPVSDSFKDWNRLRDPLILQGETVLVTIPLVARMLPRILIISRTWVYKAQQHPAIRDLVLEPP